MKLRLKATRTLNINKHSGKKLGKNYIRIAHKNTRVNLHKDHE